MENRAKSTEMVAKLKYLKEFGIYICICHFFFVPLPRIFMQCSKL